MSPILSMEKFVEILEHNADNAHDSDIWILLNKEGDTAIVPDQDLAVLQHPATWPKYICRASAVNDHVRYDTAKAADPNNPLAAVDGLYSALDHLNWAIGLTVGTSAASSVAAKLGRALAGLITNGGTQ